jgi:hypothetical protein
MANLEHNLIYIHIPKNASSWTKTNLRTLDFEFYNYHFDKIYDTSKTVLVVLRDPVDRWLSGIAEYFYLYHVDIDTTEFTPSFFDVIFDKVSFDDHTERQVYFIKDMNLDQCVFFKFELDYRNKFSKFLSSRGISNQYYNIPFKHVNEHSPERKKFKQIFSQQLTNEKYIQKIRDYFKEDYNLINSINFYE